MLHCTRCFPRYLPPRKTGVQNSGTGQGVFSDRCFSGWQRRATLHGVVFDILVGSMEIFHRSHDGLEREFKFFNWLEAAVCRTCAPGDQNHGQCGIASRAGRMDGTDAGNYSAAAEEDLKSQRTLPRLRRFNVVRLTASRGTWASAITSLSKFYLTMALQ